MKKVLMFLMSITCLTLGLIMVGCKNDEVTVSHNFSELWSNDETYHWHKCLDSDCNEVGDKSEHVFDTISVQNGVKTSTCSTCGYSISEVVGYKVTFDCDANSRVAIYGSKDYKNSPTETGVAYSVDGDSGKAVNDGEGQVNFLVSLSKNYIIESIEILRADGKVLNGDLGYKNLKDSIETKKDLVFRITKISADLIVKIKTTPTISNSKYYAKATFSTDEHSKVLLGFDSGSVAYTRSNDVYSLTNETGLGQVNFRVVLDEGYIVDSIVVTGTYKNFKNSIDIEIDNAYRITKISSAITVTITTKLATETLAHKVAFDGVLDGEVFVEFGTKGNCYSRQNDGFGSLCLDNTGSVRFLILPPKDLVVLKVEIESGTAALSKNKEVFTLSEISSDVVLKISYTQKTS